MMQYIEAPHTYRDSWKSLFLAGGITNCPNWQADIVKMLEDTSLVLLNPRQANFNISDPLAADLQIEWEHDHLIKATAILFWFPRETLCPIVLYELGAWSMTDKPIFIGAHPDYSRRVDVVIQTKLVRPDVVVVDSIADLANQVRVLCKE